MTATSAPRWGCRLPWASAGLAAGRIRRVSLQPLDNVLASHDMSEHGEDVLDSEVLQLVHSFEKLDIASWTKAIW